MLIELIEPYYPKAGRGRQPLGLEKVLRVYLLQIWLRFAGVELSDDVASDEGAILRCRHLLEKHKLTETMFEQINGVLELRNKSALGTDA